MHTAPHHRRAHALTPRAGCRASGAAAGPASRSRESRGRRCVERRACLWRATAPTASLKTQSSSSTGHTPGHTPSRVVASRCCASPLPPKSESESAQTDDARAAASKVGHRKWREMSRGGTGAEGWRRAWQSVRGWFNGQCSMMKRGRLGVEEREEGGGRLRRCDAATTKTATSDSNGRARRVARPAQFRHGR
jgi:hypothetical protein